MPPTTDDQIQRRSAIRELLQQRPAATQASLVSALQSRGYGATQSSLREIGAIKTAHGYELPAANDSGDDHVASVAELLRATTSAGPNLLVIHTAVGGAQRVGLALDRCGWPGIVGTIAGDDTVFIATDSAAAQKNLITRIERTARS